MLALTVVQGGLVGASPLFLKWVVDALGQDPRSQEAIIWGLVYIVTLAVARVSAEIQMLAFGNLEQGFIHHIRTKAFSHIVSLPLSFHLDQHPGRLNQRISSGSNSVTMLLQVLANIALPAIIQIVMAVVIIAASGDLQIAAVFVASFSLYGAIYYRATRRLVARQRKAADAAADLGATLTDGLLHPETSKYLNAEEALSERIGQQSGKTGAAWVKFYRERVRAQLLVTAVFAMTLAVTILLSILCKSWNAGCGRLRNDHHLRASGGSTARNPWRNLSRIAPGLGSAQRGLATTVFGAGTYRRSRFAQWPSGDRT